MSVYHKYLMDKKGSVFTRKMVEKSPNNKAFMVCPACRVMYRRVFKEQKACLACVKKAVNLEEHLIYVTS